MSTRFDYVDFDETAKKKSAQLREIAVTVEAHIEKLLPGGRAKSLAITKLEETFSWVFKGIRDDQLERYELEMKRLKAEAEADLVRPEGA